MTDKKLTESEIVKLLECCKKSQCSNCEYSKKCDGYTQVNYALDLITRQQAENETLKALNGRLVVLGDRFRSELKTAKAEAYKEFARRLKCGVPQETGVIRCSDVDNLVKEMVGDDNVSAL